MHGNINEIAVSRTSVSPALFCWRTRLWMEAGWKTFAVVLQHCSEAKCLCIDLAERENREIFHMFISRTAWDKQPSLSLSLLLLKAQPVQVIKILPSQGEITLCLVAKAQSWKDSHSALSLFVSFVGPSFLPFVYLSNLHKVFWSSSLPSSPLTANQTRFCSICCVYLSKNDWRPTLSVQQHLARTNTTFSLKSKMVQRY